jgi:hypothetical protein
MERTNNLRGLNANLFSIKQVVNMTYLLKARIVEPEKQPLLANGSETTFVSRQRLGKHIPAATNK